MGSIEQRFTLLVPSSTENLALIRDFVSNVGLQAGLGVFMSFIEEVREKGGDIKICSLVPKVRQIFDILGFQAIYDMVESRDEAVRRFVDVPTREV